MYGVEVNPYQLVKEVLRLIQSRRHRACGAEMEMIHEPLPHLWSEDPGHNREYTRGMRHLEFTHENDWTPCVG